jgi:hypothetical protein
MLITMLPLVPCLTPGHYTEAGWTCHDAIKHSYASVRANLHSLDFTNQHLPAGTAVDVFFFADLRPIFELSGNRCYRAVQLEGGILGGKLHLAAYAQRLGATGLTFYDNAVTYFFFPHGEGNSAILLVAVGDSGKQTPLAKLAGAMAASATPTGEVACTRPESRPPLKG